MGLDFYYTNTKTGFSDIKSYYIKYYDIYSTCLKPICNGQEAIVCFENDINRIEENINRLKDKISKQSSFLKSIDWESESLVVLKEAEDIVFWLQSWKNNIQTYKETIDFYEKQIQFIKDNDIDLVEWGN